MTALAEVHVPGRLWTLNDERSGVWQTHRARTREWRETAGLAWLTARVPRPLPPVVVHVYPLQRRRGPLADVLAHVGPVKAVVDALVDVGALPDDGSDYVRAVCCYPPTRADDDTGEGLRVRLLPA